MNIEIRRSNRRTLAIEVTRDAKVIVRAPYRIPMAEIERFVTEKAEWIEKCLEKVNQRKAEHIEHRSLSMDDISILAKEAQIVIPKKVAYYARELGVNYGRITIRNQKSRWGSCSGKGNLNFNCLLMLTPERVQDYVVIHELCHRKEMNHSQRFWNEVAKVMPDYKEQRQWLKEHGGTIINRMTG